MNTMMMILLLLILIPVFISLMFIPYWTRKTESFGVSIPEEAYASTVLKEMRKQYVQLTGILSIVTMALFLLLGLSIGNDENTISILFAIIITVFMITSFLIYLKFHQHMKKIKEKHHWSQAGSGQIFIDTRFRQQKITYSNLWFLLSFIIAFGTLLITFQFYDQIPKRIPMQYNFSGEVTNWANKSIRTVMIMPIMEVYLILLFVFINVIIARAKQQISAENPDQSIKQNVIFRKRWSAYIIVTGTALTLMFSFIQLSFIFPIDQQLLIIIPLAFGIATTIGAIVLAVTTGQGGSRVYTGMTKDRNAINRDDDQYWKLGVLYFNRDDPALFLEKRFGVGWTVNLARPSAWIILIVIISIAAGIPILMGL